MAFEHAKRCDQEIDRLSNRAALPAKKAIVPGCLNRYFWMRCVEYGKLHQFAGDFRRLLFVPYSLQHLAQDYGGDAKALGVDLGIEPLRFGIVDAVEVINPHRRVDDDHGGLFRGTPQPGAMQVSVPRDLPPQTPEPGLLPRLNQEAQAFFHGCALGRSAAVAQGVAHELIVDVDICTHGYLEWPMCKNRMFVCKLSRPAESHVC